MSEGDPDGLPCEVRSPDGQLYRLTRRIASGAFGKVFECEVGGRRYAAKRIQRGDDEQLKKWAAEASLLVGLQRQYGPHPNIADIQALFYTPDHEYLILERCDGTLEDLLTERRLGDPWVVPFAEDVLRALSWIHETGTLHGDLSIENVLYRVTDEADRSSFVFKLADFGLHDRWSTRVDDEHPERTAEDIHWIARLVCCVALNDPDAWQLTAEELQRLVAANWRPPIERALFGGFHGEHAARAFFEALAAAAG